MSAADSIERAAAGELPPWAVVTDARRRHIGRVAALLASWADALGLDARERGRWVAAGWLHDALRDADPEALRPLVPPELRGVAGRLLHGPAAAARLRAEGVRDEPLLTAVAYHTLGHAGLDRLGRALYLADFLEPGRSFRPVWRAVLRARMPERLDDVVVEVARARIAHLLENGTPIRPETVGFWNDLVRRRGDA